MCVFLCVWYAAMKQRKLYEETLYILASEASEVAAAAEAATNTRHQTVITTTNHVL